MINNGRAFHQGLYDDWMCVISMREREREFINSVTCNGHLIIFYIIYFVALLIFSHNSPSSEKIYSHKKKKLLGQECFLSIRWEWDGRQRWWWK
jgi:hypothetical protein